MTTFFVSSVSGDNTTGVSWATAKTTVAGGLGLCSAGDILLVDHSHSFTATGAITWTPPAGGIAIISVTPSGAASFSAFTAGATESIGASNNAFTVAGAAAAAFYINGMKLNGASGTAGNGNISLVPTNAVVSYLEMVNCTFDLLTTSTTNILLASPGSIPHQVRLRDCTFNCTGSRTTSYFSIGAGIVDIINPTISFGGASKPTSLITAQGTSSMGTLTMRDGDASGFSTAASALVLLTSMNAQVLLKNLKVSATPTITSGSWTGATGSITLRNVDSGNTDYVFQYIDSFGTLTADIGVYKNSGSSFNSQAVSWKIVTTSLASEFKPFATPLLQIWDTSTSGQSPTLSVAQATAATNLNDRTAWMTIDAAASASATNYTFFTGRNAQPFVGSAVDWAADSGATWTGISSPNKQLLSLGTVTPARAGLLQGRLFIAAGSVTVYVNAVIDGIT